MRDLGQVTLDLFPDHPSRDLELSQWFTPPSVADLMAQWVKAGPHDSILEPMAGSGALVRALIRAGVAERSWIDMVEVDPRFQPELSAIATKWGARARVWIRDFFDPPEVINPPITDVSVMNPAYEDGVDGRAVSRGMDLSDRVVALLRSAALHTVDRHRQIWGRKDFGLSREARFIRRPKFGEGTGAKSDFTLVELTRGHTGPTESIWV